ncbi:MAG TPA: CHASE3 domain-containing protein [Kofleriaceae bacterium]
MKLRMRIGLMFAAGFGVVALATVMSWFGAEVLYDTTREVRTIHERLDAFDDVLGDVVDVETGARGFAITGQDSYVEPYDRAVARLPEHLERLAELVAHDPVPRARVAVLNQTEARQLAHFRELVRVRREAGAEAARALVTTGVGFALMEQVRGMLDDLRAAEMARLAELTRQSDHSTRQAFELIVGSAIAVGLLVLIGTLVLTRSITRPIGALASAANRIARGEWPAIARERADEIGELAEALSAMARARREAEDRLRALLDHAPDAVFVADRDGRYTDVNVAATQLLGYRRGELVGKTVLDLIPAEDAPRLAAIREALLVAGAVDVSEWSLLRDDGTRVPVEVSAKILSDGRWQTFVRNISERKRAQAERELLLEREREHRRRLQALREAALAISPLATTSSGKTAQVLRSIAEQARRLARADFTGLSIDADRERPSASWVWSGLSEAEAAAIGAWPRPRDWLAGAADPAQAQRIAPSPGHAEALGALLTVPIRGDGAAIGELCLARRPGAAPFTGDDRAITELLVIHAAVAIENAKLYDAVQAAVAAREDLLAVVSHDLKNPLNAILLREELLERRHIGDRELAEHARWVRRSLGNMNRLIQGLLDAASLDAGRLALDIEVHDLGEVIGEVIDALGPIAVEGRIAFECRLPEPCVARFDRERVAQVVYNLVGNAVKFTPSGGRIAIAGTLSPAELHLEVSDTGRGIAPDVLPHIFERYFTTEHGRRGTGLGLHISRGIVEAHGGRIWATSVPGHGATFHLMIPTHPVPPAAVGHPVPEASERPSGMP